jgi:NADH:ubiquinone oxidoreductase subunit 5 (subunit L)/multisubunit Na+/H+ antiporter MnhA subunit
MDQTNQITYKKPLVSKNWLLEKAIKSKIAWKLSAIALLTAFFIQISFAITCFANPYWLRNIINPDILLNQSAIITGFCFAAITVASLALCFLLKKVFHKKSDNIGVEGASQDEKEKKQKEQKNTSEILIALPVFLLPIITVVSTFIFLDFLQAASRNKFLGFNFLPKWLLNSDAAVGIAGGVSISILAGLIALAIGYLVFRIGMKKESEKHIPYMINSLNEIIKICTGKEKKSNLNYEELKKLSSGLTMLHLSSNTIEKLFDESIDINSHIRINRAGITTLDDNLNLQILSKECKKLLTLVTQKEQEIQDIRNGSVTYPDFILNCFSNIPIEPKESQKT